MLHILSLTKWIFTQKSITNESISLHYYWDENVPEMA